MPNYVLSFRPRAGGGPDPEQEAAWGAWLGSISGSIVDGGHRVAGSRVIGASTGDTVLGGYIVVSAADIDEAESIASGCPGLSYGGAVDVAAVIE